MVFNYQCLICGSNTYELVVPGLNPDEEIYECINCGNLLYKSELQPFETQISRIDNKKSDRIIT